jgi:hypothetical protein
VPKLDLLIKHSSLRKSLVVRPRIAIKEYSLSPSNAHVKNEKVYATIGQFNVIDQLHNGGKVGKKIKMCNLLHYGTCSNMATQWQTLKSSNNFSNFWRWRNVLKNTRVIRVVGPWPRLCTKLCCTPSKLRWINHRFLQWVLMRWLVLTTKASCLCMCMLLIIKNVFLYCWTCRKWMEPHLISWWRIMLLHLPNTEVWERLT